MSASRLVAVWDLLSRLVHNAHRRSNVPRPRIGCIVEQRYLRQEMPRRVIRLLRSEGVDIDVLCTAGGRFDPRRGVFRAGDGGEFDLNGYDGVVARGRDALGLDMLCYADAAGLPAINTHAATQRVRNKAHMAIELERAGIAAAPTMLAADVAALAELPEEWFPLILKATYGDNSQGLRVARRPEDLWDIHWGDDLVLAQHYLPNQGFDLKLYVCGERVFAARKPSPFNGDRSAPAQPAQADAHMVDLALRCGRAFGLEIYGVDTIETSDGVAVIEVNEFPNFTGVPEAARHIVDHVLARIAGRVAAPAAPAGAPRPRSLESPCGA
jgi:ribosomal protein S6--L-glutamate ligase